MTKPQKIEGGWRDRISVEISYDAYAIKLDDGYLDTTEELHDFISTEIEKAKAEERQRIVNGLFKPNHRYIVWLEKNELKVLDEASIKIK